MVVNGTSETFSPLSRRDTSLVCQNIVTRVGPRFLSAGMSDNDLRLKREIQSEIS